MKDIKTKPQTTTKSVKNAPKSVEHSAKQAVKDIKTVSKDVIIKNIVDKQLDTRQSEQPQRAEVEATEQVENTYYSAVDTVYQKGKSLAENKLKQHGKIILRIYRYITRACRKQKFQHPKHNEVYLIPLYPQNLCRKQRKATYAHTAKLRPTS